MKKLFTLIILLYSGSYFCYSQILKKAVVTDVNYFMCYGNHYTINPSYSPQSYFPLYFHFPGFIADIHSDITKLIKERFHTDTVIFLYPDSVSITKDWKVPAIKAQDTAKKSNENGTVFISVETILWSEAIISNEKIYNFTTRVKAYIKGGKKVYKFTNHIPFVCYNGEEISGNTLMSENDFYTFYFDGLDLAFKRKTKRTYKRYIAKPHTSHYNDFLNESEKFYLTKKKNGYTYGNSYDNMVEVLSFNTDLWQYPHNMFNMNSIIYHYVVKDKYNLHNRFTNEDYLVSLKGEGNILSDFLSPSSSIAFTINTKDDEELGNFIFQKKQLKAEIQGKNYQIKWNGIYNVAEVSAANQQIALMKYMDEERVIYIRNSLTEEQLGDLFNLIFIYDFATLVQQVLKY